VAGFFPSSCASDTAFAHQQNGRPTNPARQQCRPPPAQLRDSLTRRASALCSDSAEEARGRSVHQRPCAEKPSGPETKANLALPRPFNEASRVPYHQGRSIMPRVAPALDPGVPGRTMKCNHPPGKTARAGIHAKTMTAALEAKSTKGHRGP
jgi:hypothetical protein